MQNIPNNIPIPFIEFQAINVFESELANNIAKECIEIVGVDQPSFIINEFYMRLIDQNICETKLSTLAIVYLFPYLKK